jgi:PST family polysaccharide transporter
LTAVTTSPRGTPDVVKAVAWSAFEKWGTRAGTLLIFAVLSRLLDPVHFGLVALASVFVELVSIVVERGMGQALIQKPQLDSVTVDTAFWLSAGSGLILTAALALLAPVIGAMTNEPGVTGVLRWLSIGFLFASISSVPTALLQRSFAFGVLARRRLIAATVAGVIGVVVAVRGGGVASLVVQSLAQNGIVLVISWRAIGRTPSLQFDRHEARRLLAFAATVSGTELLSFLSRRSDDLLIGVFLGARALGYYVVGYRILLIAIELLTSTLSSVAMPVFARLQDDPDALREAFCRATRFSAAIAAPAFAGLAAVAGRVTPLAFGPNWMPSVPVMQVLAVVGLLHSVTYFDRIALIAVGEARRELRLTFIDTVGNVAAFGMAVHFGVVAVACAFAIRSYLFWPIRLRVIRDVLRISPSEYLQQWVRPVLASGVVVAAVLLVSPFVNDSWLALLLLVGIGALVYGAVTAVINADLVRDVVGIVARRRRVAIAVLP